MNLSMLVQAHARARPDAPALLSPLQPKLDYAALWQQMQAISGALTAAGATASTPVATALPNGVDAALGFLGVAIGSPCAPLNCAAPAVQLRADLEATGARYLLVSDSLLCAPARQAAHEAGVSVIELAQALASGLAHRALPSPAEAVALILQTSGTTSRPKLVPLTHANVCASAATIATHLALTPTDRCLNVMPLFHIHGLVGVLLTTLAAGASVICLPGFDGEAFLDAVTRFHPSWYSAVPTIHQAVAQLAPTYRQRSPEHHFRFVRSSSAALPPATLRALEAGLGSPVIEAYGMTEASHQMASNPLPPALRKPGSVGLSAGAEIGIVNEQGQLLPCGQAGEIVIRGPGVMAGYGGNYAANGAAFVNGWFRTGDMGQLDADGYLFIVGRLKEIVNRGGEKVFPGEVDEALLEHHAVMHAAAFGVPHPSLGEDLVAAVVRRPGAVVDAAELRQFLFGRLAGHKVPSRLILVDQIPKGATGKVQRNSLAGHLRVQLEPAFRAPETELERSIERMLRAAFGVERIGLDDNFFALGADSLRCMQAAARLNDEHRIELRADSLFRHPTLAELAREIQRFRASQQDRHADLAREIEALSDDEVQRLLALEEAASATPANCASSPRPASG